MILLLAITALIAGLMVYDYYDKRKKSSAFLIMGAAEKAEGLLLGFFGPPIEITDLVKNWTINGTVRLSEPSSLGAKFIPLLERQRQVHCLTIWKNDRLEYLLLREGESWLTRYRNKSGQATWRSLDSNGKSNEKWDAAAQPSQEEESWNTFPSLSWKQSLVWTVNYPLPPASKKGMTTATRWKDSDNVYIAAVSVLMTDITELAHEIKIGKSLRFFLASGDGFFIDFNGRTATVPEGSSLGRSAANGDAGGDPLFSKAIEIWLQKGKTLDPFSFGFQGETWWGYILGLKGSRQNTAICLLAMETDLIDMLGYGHILVLAAIMVLWGVFVFYAFRHYREIRAVLDRMKPASMSDQDILDIIAGGESDNLEFKSTLRWNLKSGKPGKEIELASLKTVCAFMNTDGGTLLVGVDDEGEILGIEADNFPNDDKYLRHFSSIFNQHIGLEFSEFVDFSLKSVKNGQVLVVHCRPSPNPVFLRNNKDESFYIRSGPSSRQLTTSQVLDYLKERSQDS